jgi:small subunit ribosomal protein S9
MTTTTKEEIQKAKEEPVKLKGKYHSAIGRRKTATARVRVYKKGSGAVIVNDQKAEDYFTPDGIRTLKQPLKMAGNLKDYTISAVVHGGGKVGQSEAICLGLTRALVDMDSELKPAMKAKGLMTRDDRRKERKKPGLKKARRAPQWSKR